jgi:hypothetical protein
MLGPGTDAEALIMDALNRQDRRVASRTSKALRRRLGARVTTLVLHDDELPAVDLAPSFPALHTLVLHARRTGRTGDFEALSTRFRAFTARNAACLTQLQTLECCYPLDGDGSSLAALAQLPSLQSLKARARDCTRNISFWSAALSSLTQLTSLTLGLSCTSEFLEAVVQAAPKLQVLWLDGDRPIGPYQLGCLSSLASLRSLRAEVDAEDVCVYDGHWDALTDLQQLTHLRLSMYMPVVEEDLGPGGLPEDLPPYMESPTIGLLRAVGQLTGLSSLDLDLSSDWMYSELPLAPLAALQQLTALRLDAPQPEYALTESQARVLAGLPQLRRLEAYFASSAAAAAAGLARLEECRPHVYCNRQEGAAAVVVAVAGQVTLDSLTGFEISGVRTLIYNSGSFKAVDAVALQSCQQLRALRCALNWVAGQPAAALQAIAALPKLEHLSLYKEFFNWLDGAALAALAGCSRLKQLTLEGVRQLPESTLVALMGGLQRLRLLRLLGCSPELSQQRCQALVGRLGLWALQVDVVVRDSTAGLERADWMIAKLGERWAEA